MALADAAFGLGGFLNQVNLGLERAQDRDWLEEQRGMQRDQASFQKEQQAQQRADWQREDELRKKNAQVADTETVDLNANAQPVIPFEGTEADAVKPAPNMVTRKRTMDSILRDYAFNAREAGDMRGYVDFMGRADKFAMDRESKAWNAFAAGLDDNASVLDIAKRAQQHYNADPGPGKILDVHGGDNGAVVLSMLNRDTGEQKDVTFTDRKKLLDALNGHFAPENYGDYLAARRKAQFEVDKEAAKERVKPVITPYGGVSTDHDGRVIYDNSAGRTLATMSRAGGLGGSRAGAGGGKPPPNAVDESIKNAIANSATKFENPEQAAHVATQAKQMLAINPKLSADLAVESVAGSLTNPERVSYGVDRTTGKVGRLYQHPTKGPIPLDMGVSPDDVPKEKRQALADDLLAGFTPTPLDLQPQGDKTTPWSGQAWRDQLMTLAKDPSGTARENLASSLASALEIKARQAGATEEQMALIPEAVRKRMAQVDSQVEMLRRWHSGSRPDPAGLQVDYPGGLTGASRYQPPSAQTRRQQIGQTLRPSNWGMGNNVGAGLPGDPNYLP